MIQLDRSHARRAAVDRRADRLVAMFAIVIALGFLMLAIAMPLLGVASETGLWLPIHLALAGAATTAIAGVMPFFSAAIATTQPVDARVRWASLAAISCGAAGITVGYVGGALTLAAASGTVFSVGVVLVGYATLAPLRRGLGPKGGIVALGYGAALAMVLSGAMLATLYLAGWAPVLEAWGYLRPAHAWINLVGFVSVVIATTLLHFFPTVIGARIQRVPAAYMTTIGLALGAALTAVGFALRSDLLARAGVLLVAVGAVALAFYAIQVWRTRATWTGDQGWHRFAMGGLVSAVTWFVLGILIATTRILLDGAHPDAVRMEPIAGPLIAGWMALAVLSSATHLVPAIGPGDPHEHARQRTLLGRLGLTRLVAIDVGVAAVSLGLIADIEGLTAIALLLLAVSLATTAGLLAAAVLSGIRNVRSARP